MFENIIVDGGSVKVYTGPRKGKFYINKSGKKVYLDRKSLNDEVPYTRKPKKTSKGKKVKKAKSP
jgi:hypothetical protein